MTRYDRRSGIGILLTMVLCLAMVPMVGIAIDGTNAYLMRGQLRTALDAAVLAGARSLGGNYDLATQGSNANAFAQQVFTANVSNLSANITVVPSFNPVQTTASHYRIVSGTATATMPLSMMSIIGVSTTRITVTASAQRRDVNMMLVLDHSSAVSAVLPILQSDATTFVNMFADGRDNVGLVGFTGSAVVAFPLQTNFLSGADNIPAQINNLATYKFGSMNSAAGLWAAYQQLKTLNNPGALNVIVYFTGGVPNAISANFAGLVTTDCLPGSNPLNAFISTDPYVFNYMVGFSSPVDISTGTVNATDLNYRFEYQPPPTTNGCISLPQQYMNGAITGLSSIPSTDLNGNSTDGTGSIPAYAPIASMAQVGFATVSAAAENAFDDAANKIRSDPTLAPVIYTIGLLGLPETPPDPVLLGRIANDPGSVFYNASQPSGVFLSTPSSDQLSTAFARIASEVLRLSN